METTAVATSTVRGRGRFERRAATARRAESDRLPGGLRRGFVCALGRATGASTLLVRSISPKATGASSARVRRRLQLCFAAGIRSAKLCGRTPAVAPMEKLREVRSSHRYEASDGQREDWRDSAAPRDGHGDHRRVFRVKEFWRAQRYGADTTDRQTSACSRIAAGSAHWWPLIRPAVTFQSDSRAGESPRTSANGREIE